jgi:hypothetical protein
MADINKAKKLLEEAMRNLPMENAYSATKIHIKRAISEIFHTEQKKVKKVAQTTPNWKLDMETGRVLPPSVVEAREQKKTMLEMLGLLDAMYAQEEQKLHNLDRKDTKKNDNNLGPLLG